MIGGGHSTMPPSTRLSQLHKTRTDTQLSWPGNGRK